MAESRMETLSVEIFECINVLLNFEDLKALRLASRTTAQKASQVRFRSFFKSKHVKMQRHSLQNLVDMTANMTATGSIMSLLEDLTLVGVVNNTAALEYQLRRKTKDMVWPDEDGEIYREPEELGSETEIGQAAAELGILKERQADWEQLQSEGGHITLLRKGFSNFPRLASLTTEVIVYRADSKAPLPASESLGWRSVWRVAAETFHAVMHALAESKLPVRKLNFFNEEFAGRCSLQCNELSRCDRFSNLQGLESLSISISDRVLDEFTDDAGLTGDPVDMLDGTRHFLPMDVEALRAIAADEANFVGLPILLDSCPQLRKLDFQLCSLARYQSGLEILPDEFHLLKIAKMVYLPFLEILRIGGFDARARDILAFLEKHSNIQDLSLVSINLQSGASWGDIIDYCAANVPALRFEDLSQDGNCILFDETIDEDTPPEDSLHEGIRKGQNIYSRSGGVSSRIRWHVPRNGRLTPQPHVKLWLSRQRKRSGPPI